tara:strand:- start:1725 stop:2732 length:1008 start_codon:yes stop_codon:yes gene_type:complete
MNVLLFTDPHEDYLADALVHGFRELFGAQAVDYPKCEILYNNCNEQTKAAVRGNGFTLYSGLLDDIYVDRFNIKQRIIKGYFDLIIFTNIQRQFGLYEQYRPFLKGHQVVCVDGEDTPMPFPARGFFMRKPYYWLLPLVHKKHLYFKREYTSRTVFMPVLNFLPELFKRYLPKPKNIKTIQFAFPQSKILSAPPVSKSKLFTTHIVDEEVAQYVKGSFTAYAFDNEADYYSDIQHSKFGITTKRAGWDCLRHYEIAANGAVLCFKDLDQKPASCAPHGLDASNSISYRNYEDLMQQIEALSDEDYTGLQKNSLLWASSSSTLNLARYILKSLKQS